MNLLAVVEGLREEEQTRLKSNNLDGQDAAQSLVRWGKLLEFISSNVVILEGVSTVKYVPLLLA